jgi:hypothetical protein
MKRLLKLTYAYIILSLFTGPGILSFGLGDHPSGGDCGDSSWGSASFAVREAYFADASIRLLVPASIMAALGVTLLVLLLRRGFASGEKSRVMLPSLGIILMLSGYLMLILLAMGDFC